MDLESHSLHRILHPASVAFVGASNNIQTMGTVHLNTLIHSGFAGPIYPVHPKETEILGLKAYPDIASIPEPADLLVMLVNRERVAEMLDQAGKLGIRRAVIVSGGFAEALDHGGDLQKQVYATAEKHGISVIGPNCIGVMNPHAPMNVTYFPYEGQAGDIGLLSHSGTYLCHMYSYLSRRGMGLAAGMSLGNEMNLDVVDGIEYYAKLDSVKSIALYLETVRRPREFVEVCRRVGKIKPIVAFTAGTTDAGARAVASHTAALTGKRGVFEGLLAQAGVIRAEGVQELFDMANATAKQIPMKGPRVAILTNSGGPGASAAESLERYGLQCPELSPETQAKLTTFLPHTGSAKNPVDFTYAIDLNAMYVEVPNAIMQDPGVDGLMIYGIFGTKFWEKMGKTGLVDLTAFEAFKEVFQGYYDQLAELPAKYGKPLVLVAFDGLFDDATEQMRARGIPVLPSPERAARCIWALHEQYKRTQR
jgi:acyl-CoA synthetase (NDP forming)